MNMPFGRECDWAHTGYLLQCPALCRCGHWPTDHWATSCCDPGWM